MGHRSIEHKLRADIEERHNLKNEIEKKQSLVNKLTRKLEHGKKKQSNNRYSATIKRLNAEVETLKCELNEMNLDLQNRITNEVKFSEEEVRNFTDQYKKEYAEMIETQSKLNAIEEGTMEPDVEGESGEESVPKEAIVARTKRILDRERRIVDGIQKELSSEERDKVLFARELEQIMAELKAYSKEQI